MRVFSYVRKGIDLEAVEIEISLVPGVPTFHLIGLPDASIKESVIRIKSALRHQGFKLPQREQVIIHLKPSHEKKSSLGLDLAIAAAYLWRTEQLKVPSYNNEEKIFLYGEVSLEGAVVAPQDIELLEKLEENSVLISGQAKNPAKNFLHFHHGRVETLRDLENVTWCEGRFSSVLSEPLVSRFEDYEFAPTLARLMAVVGAGEHNVFIAGPAGSGKTTFSEALHSLLREPTVEEKSKIEKIARITGKEIAGRPFISPHHGSTDIALLGGGVPPYPGEITRAQHGVLVLDEFLEFKSYVKESLREPIEKHEITICRSGAKVTFPADFLLIGTTNLCPCGEYVPSEPAPCGASSSRCKSYYQRLSGPLLDRFEIVSFSHNWRKKQKSESLQNLAGIRLQVKAAQDFALKSRGQKIMNSRLCLKECEATVPDFVRKNLLPELPTSHRRLAALYRVARTLADLAGEEKILGLHIEGAKNLTIRPFQEIKEAWR